MNNMKLRRYPSQRVKRCVIMSAPHLIGIRIKIMSGRTRVGPNKWWRGERQIYRYWNESITVAIFPPNPSSSPSSILPPTCRHPLPCRPNHIFPHPFSPSLPPRPITALRRVWYWREVNWWFYKGKHEILPRKVLDTVTTRRILRRLRPRYEAENFLSYNNRTSQDSNQIHAAIWN